MTDEQIQSMENKVSDETIIRQFKDFIDFNNYMVEAGADSIEITASLENGKLCYVDMPDKNKFNNKKCLIRYIFDTNKLEIFLPNSG